jgi:glycosyltransferase involved in cell wall biosynthesis
MKIAYIYDVIYPYVRGGAEKRFWELAKRLSARGHEVHLYGMKSWEGGSCLVREGVHIHGVGSPMKLYTNSGIRDVRQVFSFTRQIFPALIKERFDVIDCNAFPYLPFFPVKLYALLKKTPLVITWQEVWGKYWHTYYGRIKGEIARWIEKVVARASGTIVTHSQQTKNALICLGAKEERITISAHGVDFTAIEGVSSSPEKSDVIFAGRLIKEKNIDIVLKSVAIIKNETSEIRCIIIGEGPEKERLMQLAESLHLKENIVFKPFLEYAQMLSLLKASKVFVFPSTREGFGIAVIEAMACGLPVITVHHPMNASLELIKDGENGFICAVDEKDIAAKILLLCKDTGAREAMALRALSSVRKFDWDRITDESEWLYRSVIP